MHLQLCVPTCVFWFLLLLLGSVGPAAEPLPVHPSAEPIRFFSLLQIWTKDLFAACCVCAPRPTPSHGHEAKRSCRRSATASQSGLKGASLYQVRTRLVMRGSTATAIGRCFFGGSDFPDFLLLVFVYFFFKKRGLQDA